jgi:hypothetical protein
MRSAQKRWLWRSSLALLAAAAASWCPAAYSASGPVPGYLLAVPPESASERERRLEEIRERRRGPVVIVHRGASAFAPENTLEAYAAAMDQGADGCEIDLRRTRDGVIVLFHDDMLDQLTPAFGVVGDLTYRQLLDLQPRRRYGLAGHATRPPTFAAVLELARRRRMLLHLDVKEPGLDAALAEGLQAAGAWEHVVAVNTANATALARDPRVSLLRYKGPGLYAGRKDLDPEAVRAQLALPGEMIMVDDARVPAHVLGRKSRVPSAVPGDLRVAVSAPASLPPPAGRLLPQEHLLRRFPDPGALGRDELLAILAGGDRNRRTQPLDDPDAERRRTQEIVERAWTAQELGRRGKRDAQVVAALERQVRSRSFHRDWMYHALDACMAIRALGELRSRESVPVLLWALELVDPDVRRVANPAFGDNPVAWTDFRLKMPVPEALGRIRTPESRRVLQRYLALSDEAARRIAPPMHEEAVRALMRHDLDREDILHLLRDPRSAVRGTALLECVDNPSPDRRAALREAAPWAADLPVRPGRPRFD